MTRLFVKKEWIRDREISLSGREAHYLHNVLRLKPGDLFWAILEGEAELKVRIRQADAKQVRGEIIERRNVPPPADHQVALMQAVLKSAKMSWLIQKSTELGADILQPVITERTVVRLKEGAQPAKLERWRLIAQEAAEQCGAVRLPKIRNPISLSQALEDFGAWADLRLFLWERGGELLRKVLTSEPRPKKMALLIGPEGGFTDEEASLAEQHHFIPVSLGRRILRSETAALSALTLATHHLQLEK